LNARGREPARLAAVADDDLVLVDPWEDLRPDTTDNAAERQRLAVELDRELAPGHSLFGSELQLVSRCRFREDLLVQVANGDWALVHLAYDGEPRPPGPSTEYFATAAAVEHRLKSGALTFDALPPTRFGRLMARPPLRWLDRLLGLLVANDPSSGLVSDTHVAVTNRHGQRHKLEHVSAADAEARCREFREHLAEIGVDEWAEEMRGTIPLSFFD
jgi:hypothetical protein